MCNVILDFQIRWTVRLNPNTDIEKSFRTTPDLQTVRVFIRKVSSGPLKEGFWPEFTRISDESNIYI